MSAEVVQAPALDLRRVLRPGDRIAWGQACAEPIALLEALAEQAEAIGRLSGFCGLTFRPDIASRIGQHVALTSYGAMPGLRDLVVDGGVRILPSHLSALPSLLTRGALRCDVAFVQVAPAGRDGRHSLGVAAEYVHDVAMDARVVVAEVNERLPQTPGAAIPATRIDLAIHTSRPPLVAPAPAVRPLDRTIAARAAALVDDGDCVQFGLGALPDAIAAALTGHRRLGVHSGMVSDAVVDLVEQGVVTGEHKRRDRGLIVAGAALGTERLFEFMHRNETVRLCPTSYTHDHSVLRDLGRLVAINAALEVDLTGQVCAEHRHLGAVGGQVDFVRGAVASGGRALIALASRDPTGRPAIVPALSGAVTTPRSDVDIIVTEHGHASLRGLDLGARAAALTAVAHPDDRDTLMRAWAQRRPS